MRLCVDAILFGFDKESRDLKILLIQRKYDPFINCWALPGGFVQETENLEQAVLRELREESGLDQNPFLEQLYTFGGLDRDPRERIISVAYFGLINTIELKAATDAKDAKWFSIKNLPQNIAFDHSQIIRTALERLRGKIIYQPIGFELLPDKFTFTSLHRLYETILDRELDRRNFKKKILSLDIIDELEEKVNAEGAGRPATLFQFNKVKYDEKVKAGFYFEL